jgi:DNA-directed RNA polymerase subunit RPC12/RpoP
MSGKIIRPRPKKEDVEDDIEDIWGSEGHIGEYVRCPYCQRRFIRK